MWHSLQGHKHQRKRDENANQYSRKMPKFSQFHEFRLICGPVTVKLRSREPQMALTRSRDYRLPPLACHAAATMPGASGMVLAPPRAWPSPCSSLSGIRLGHGCRSTGFWLSRQHQRARRTRAYCWAPLQALSLKCPGFSFAGFSFFNAASLSAASRFKS